MNYYVYLIGSRKNNILKTYVGYTINLKNRLKKHNTNAGAKSTRGRLWKIFHFKFCGASADSRFIQITGTAKCVEFRKYDKTSKCVW